MFFFVFFCFLGNKTNESNDENNQKGEEQPDSLNPFILAFLRQGKSLSLTHSNQHPFETSISAE